MDDNLLDELLLGSGAMVLLLAFAAFRQARRFAARCLTTEGWVAGSVREESDDGVTYFARIRFRDVRGQEHEIPGPGLREEPAVGDTVPVTYDPNYPTNAWAPGCIAPWGVPALVLFAGVALVIAGVVLRLE
jgi:hypothetical protein